MTTTNPDLVELLRSGIGREFDDELHLTGDEARAIAARIEELEQALRPFADIADLIDCETEGLSDTDECNLLFHDYLMARYTVAQFRRARSALGAS